VEEESGLSLSRFASVAKRSEASGNGLCWLVVDGTPWAAFVVAEELRPEAEAVIQRLVNQGLTVSILSGDGSSNAQKVGEALGVAAFGALRPEEKVAHVRAAQDKGGVVLFVGDGVNDAPALAAADASAALGGGADVAAAVADVVLLRDDLNTLTFCFGYTPPPPTEGSF
jgi:P-type E1-E2 ATPase